MKYQKVCYYRIGKEYNWQRISDEGWIKEISEERAKEIIDCLPNLKFIALMSTGYNIVDYVYLKEKGIPVSNIPSYSTDAVAQLVMSFILELAMNVGLHSESVKNGEWSACDDFCYWLASALNLISRCG